MREKPTLRIPLGILGLLVALALYALAVAWASQWIERLPPLGQEAELGVGLRPADAAEVEAQAERPGFHGLRGQGRHRRRAYFFASCRAT